MAFANATRRVASISLLGARAGTTSASPRKSLPGWKVDATPMDLKEMCRRNAALPAPPSTSDWARWSTLQWVLVRNELDKFISSTARVQIHYLRLEVLSLSYSTNCERPRTYQTFNNARGNLQSLYPEARQRSDRGLLPIPDRNKNQRPVGGLG